MMDEFGRVFSFTPRSVEDEWRIHRATPLLVNDKTALIFNDSGTSLVTQDGTRALNLPEADEILLRADGGIYTATFFDSQVDLRYYEFDGESHLSSHQSHYLRTGGHLPDQIALLPGMEGIEIWVDNGRFCMKLARLVRDRLISDTSDYVERLDGDLVLTAGRFLVFSEDLGVRGKFFNILDLVSLERFRCRSRLACHALGRLFVATGDADPRCAEPFSLRVFSSTGIEELPLDGPVVQMGGNCERLTVACLVGNDVELYEVVVGREDSLKCRAIDSCSGFKVLSPDGSLYSVRGYEEAFRVCSSRIVRSPYSDLPSGRRRHLSTSRSRAIHLIAPARSRGAVIHFHGGPESFEVPEGRLFSLPQWCHQQSLDWVGVNYQGSLSSNAELTRAPWHRWREAMLEDVSELLDSPGCPVVLAGWSFGAALALALGGLFPRVKGLLLGGAPGELTQHVQRACDVDVHHQDWFNLRFDLLGDDAEFFNGISGFRPGLPVLEIHGMNDSHCPIGLIDDVAAIWADRGNPWKRIALPGNEHYASTQRDAEVIIHSTRSFLTDIFGELPQRPGCV